MNNNWADHWSEWSDRKVKQAVEIFPCIYAWVEGGFAQEVECEFLLAQEFSHIYLGKYGSTPAIMARKCALKFQMALSTALPRWTLGGTSLYLVCQVSSMTFSYLALALLLLSWSFIMCLGFANLYRVEL